MALNGFWNSNIPPAPAAATPGDGRQASMKGPDDRNRNRRDPERSGEDGSQVCSDVAL